MRISNTLCGELILVAASRRAKFSLNVLFGEDGYGIDEAVKKICADVCADDSMADLNQMDAKDCAMEDVLMAISSVPMFSSTRIVLVKNFEAFSSSQQEAFVNAVMYEGESPNDRFIPDDTYVIVTSKSKYMPLKKIPSGMADVNVCEFKKKYERDAVSFISQKAREDGVKIDRDAVITLVEYTGSDLGSLASEFEKLVTYKGKDKGPITVGDVKEVSVKMPIQTVFDLCDSLAEGDVQRALDSLSDVMDSADAVQVVQSVLFTHMRGLMVARDGLDRRVPEPQLLKEIAGPSKSTFRAQKLLAQARRVTLDGTRRAMKMIEEADIAVKTGEMSSGLSMKMLIVGIANALSSGR